MERSALENELKQLIIDTLMLEDLEAGDIETDAPLFVEGLGLDSIDALELAMALQERYAVEIHDDAEENREIFASVSSLAEFVSTGRVPSASPPDDAD
jgi:acyl carrier protein